MKLEIEYDNGFYWTRCDDVTVIDKALGYDGHEKFDWLRLTPSEGFKVLEEFARENELTFDNLTLLASCERARKFTWYSDVPAMMADEKRPA